MEPDDDAMTDSTKGEGTLAHPISRLDTDGIPLNLASGISAFLLPSCVAPLPEAPASIISRFGYIGEECSVSVTDWWMSMPPGRRPDTLVVKGLPCEWFELTLSTLDRERVISACASAAFLNLLALFVTWMSDHTNQMIHFKGQSARTNGPLTGI